MTSTPGRRVLVVDDDATIASTFGAILRGEGYEVASAGNGAEAVQLARQNSFDLILLDLVMPGMDGLTALERLRAANPRAPVVILAADVDPDGEVAALRLGAAAVVLKPPDIHKLLSMADELTSRGLDDKPWRGQSTASDARSPGER
jgi:two-component system OmpR family response regulator